ncbi:hypothetical protein SPRG_01705 [Saprolegnia parasitica CBS 223.65]|uniref:Uncharacterized protein n=1 Tax=Saprolegnia parasitica (strain CBS 223.65) TaxID=695850 RepID=A0A067D545_SAPPC|nr:hypothetical protein SPRG_01705 [Saprolegnia parasitica CBS 223.65]KDO33826.1 hypothetical protein SPRG_01705 [Saprolegnia parasitica CBS 223.65]|eukprot:XP_012195462.1 hypothetical protein SPRG_01705 [Saprolegnia parasitica CBS 223.65]
MDRRETTVQAKEEGADDPAQRLNKRRRLGEPDAANGTNDHAQTIAALEAQLAEAKTAADSTEARIVVLTNKCEFLSSKNAELRARLGNASEGTETAEPSATGARGDSGASRVAALETKVTALEAQLQAAITTSNDYEKRHASVSETYRRLLSSVAQQQIALAASASELQEARAAAKACDEEAQTLARANCDLQSTIARLEAANPTGLDKTADDLRESIRMLTTSETNLTASVQQLEADLATAKAQLTTVTASSMLWQKRAETQSKRVQELSGDKQCLASAMEQLKAELATAKGELLGTLASAASFAQWQQKAERAMAQVDDLMAEKTRLAQTVKQLVAAGKSSKQGDSTTTDKSRLAVDLADTKAQLNFAMAAAKNASQYQQQAKDAAQRVEDLTAEKGRLAAAVKQLVTSSNDVKKQLSASEAASAKWRQQAITSSAKVDELSAERDQLAAANDNLTADKHRLTIENEQFMADKEHTTARGDGCKRRMAAKAEAKSNTVDVLSADKVRLASVIKWLEADLAAAKSAPIYANGQEASEHTLTSTIAQLEGDLDAAHSGDALLRRQLVASEKRAEELLADKNRVVETMKQLQADLASTTTQLEQASAAVEASKKQVRDLGASKGRLTTTIQQLSADLAKARAEMHEKADAHDKLQAQVDALMDETRRQAAVIGQLEADVATARRAPAPPQDVTALQKQIDRFKANKARLLETITQLQADLTQCKGQLETAQSAAGASLNEAHALTVEADRLRTELAALRDQTQSVAEVDAAAAAASKKELAALTAEIKQLRADLAASKLREYAAAKANILHIDESDEKLQAATRSLRTKIEELSAELASAHEQLSKPASSQHLDATCADLKAQRDQAQDAVASLTAQLATTERATTETVRDFFRRVDSMFKFAGHGAIESLLDAIYHADTTGAFEASDGIYIFAQRLPQSSGESAAAAYDAVLLEVAATAPWLAPLPSRTPYLVPPPAHANDVVSDRVRRHIALVQRFWTEKSRDLWMSSFVQSLPVALTLALEDAVAEIVVDLVDLVTHNMVDRRIGHFLHYPHPSWPLVPRGIDALPIADAPAFLRAEAAKLWPSCPGGRVMTPFAMTQNYLARHPSSDPILSVGSASAVRADVAAFCATPTNVPLVAMPMAVMAPCATLPSPGMELSASARLLPTTHQWSSALERPMRLYET